MKLHSWLAILLSSAALTSQSPAQETGVFRGRADLVVLDVSVLWHGHLSKGGLPKESFTVFENGVRQDIVAFEEIRVPEPSRITASWMSQVSSDVTTNAHADSRVMVMLLDDATGGSDPRIVSSTKEIARHVVDRLVESDLLAIVFASDSRRAQSFTSDKQKLYAAIDYYTGGFSVTTPPQGVDAGVFFKQASLDALSNSTNLLSEIPGHRKFVLYVSPGLGIDLIDSPALVTNAGSAARLAGDSALRGRVTSLMDRARSANVTIYPIDPCGLPACINPQFLRTLASNTGGYAVAETNDFFAGVRDVFRENATYYLIGYRPTNARLDGTLRKVSVDVYAPLTPGEVTVRTRRDYRAEDDSRPRPARDERALQNSIAGVLPATGVSLKMTAVPFAGSSTTQESRVAIALGIERAAGQTQASDVARVERFNLETRAFTPEGSLVQTRRDAADVRLLPQATGDIRFEVLSDIRLPPGHYQLRIALESAEAGRRGSIYTDVEVPAFQAAPLSLSGIIVNAIPAMAVGGASAMREWLPVLPTTERKFAPDTQVRIFTRLYQGGRTAVRPVTVSTRVVDRYDSVMLDRQEVVPSERFKQTERAADILVDLPTAGLGVGEYHVSIEAQLDGMRSRRDLRFSIR